MVEHKIVDPDNGQQMIRAILGAQDDAGALINDERAEVVEIEDDEMRQVED